MRGVFILSLVLGVEVALSQEFKERLVAMQQEYAGIETVHITMVMEVYENEKSNTPYFSEVADVKKQSYNYAYTFGGTSMLMNRNCLILVDKNSRQIIYTKRSLETEEQLFKDPFKMNLDSILSLYDDTSFLGTEKQGEHYRVHQKKGEIKQIDLFINPVENRITRMEYRYSDMHYVVIRFTIFDKAPVFEPETFNDTNYVVYGDGVLSAARKFRGYHVATVDGLN